MEVINKMSKEKIGWADIRYKEFGYSISINLHSVSKDDRYKNYRAICCYKYDLKKDKYMLIMLLKKSNHNMIKKVQDGYIPGERTTIREHICRVVAQAVDSHYIDQFIEQYEYDIYCMNVGHNCIIANEASEHSNASTVDDVHE